MRMRHAVWTAILFGMVFPATLSACLCQVVRTAGQPAAPDFFPLERELILRRGAVFEGRVLTMSNPSGLTRAKAQPEKPQQVRFFVVRSWQGVSTDTVTLYVGGESPCASYQRGQSYLVRADIAGTRLRSGQCDGSIPAGVEYAEEVFRTLGMPEFRGPPVGSRSFDADAVLPDSPPPTLGQSVKVVLSIDPHPQAIQIAGRALKLRARGPVLTDLPVGFYRVRITWSDGNVEVVDLFVRCEDQGSGGDECASYRRIKRELPE
jgi:hypothetical protein